MHDVRLLNIRLGEKGLHQACVKLLFDFSHLPLLLSEISPQHTMFLWKKFYSIKMHIPSWKPWQQVQSFYFFFLWEFDTCVQCTLILYNPHSMLLAPLGLRWFPPTFMSSYVFLFLFVFNLLSPVDAALVSTDAEPSAGARTTSKKPYPSRKLTLPLLVAADCQ